jgi:hypothetical protein
MRAYQGRIVEIQYDSSGCNSARIACPAGAIPQPGQYLLAHVAGERDAPLGVPLFLVEAYPDGFLAAPPLPPYWAPGTTLALWGVLGQGFRLPAHLQRLACAALDGGVGRLLPLALAALARGVSVALFTDAPLPRLPDAMEVQPLQALAEALTWPDFLALDLALERLPHLREVLGWTGAAPLPCPAQALVRAPMPCAGLAACGACAVPPRRGRAWKLACQDGPVFDLDELQW